MTPEAFDRPILESYWVIPGRLLAGEYPGNSDPETARARIDAFLQDGFDTFINLTYPHELEPYDEILREQAALRGVTAKHKRFPILDRGLPRPDEMSAILNAIDKALAAKHKVYLHCWGGVGRTGTVVGCYLRRHGRTGPEAVNQLTRWWKQVPKHMVHSHSPETTAQVRFIIDWKE